MSDDARTRSGSASAPGSSGATTASDALRRSEERYRAFVEQSAEGIWCFEVDPPVPMDWPAAEQIDAFYERSTLTECNEAMARMYGFDCREDLIGARLGDLLSPAEPSSVDYLRAFIESGYRMVDAETSEPDRSGATKHYLNNLVGITEDGHLWRVWGTQRDVTPVKALEQQLLQAQKMEAVGLLAGGVAHDFNNLLTVILGHCDLALARRFDEGDPRTALTEIRRAGQRAAELTRQLLAFSRRQVMKPRVILLNDVVGEVERMLQRLIGERIVLSLRQDPSLGAIRADPGQIEQILMNLVVNARDAMPDGGQILVETANVELDELYAGRHIDVPPGSYCMLAVSDTGSGMTEEVSERVFEPFFTTKERGQGTGLGLSTVFGIVKQSGGHISVYSEVGCGTTFKVYLPRVNDRVEAAAPREGASIEISPVTVLVVEDEEGVRRLLRSLLEAKGLRVLTASGVAEAIAVAREAREPIHVILCDVILRDGTGPEVVARLRHDWPDAAVVLTSGYTDTTVLDCFQVDPHTDFLEKPFSADSLFRVLHAALRRREAP